MHKTYTKRPWFYLTNNGFVSMRSWCIQVYQDSCLFVFVEAGMLIKKTQGSRPVPAHWHQEPGALNTCEMSCQLPVNWTNCDNTDLCAPQHQQHSPCSRDSICEMHTQTPLSWCSKQYKDTGIALVKAAPVIQTKDTHCLANKSWCWGNKPN